MELGKLGNKLRNELRRNPKKSAVLGIAALVALYFWLPLLRGWLPGGAKQAAKAKKPVAVAPVSTGKLETPTLAPEAVFGWDELLQQITHDPLMSPVALAADVRNPFRLSEELQQERAAREEELSTQAVKAVAPPPEATPQKLGLVLQGTLTGARPAATISGRTYSRFAQIKIGSPVEPREGEQAKDERIAFTLAEVGKDYVVLTRDNQSYTLSFRRTEPVEGKAVALDAAPTDDN